MFGVRVVRLLAVGLIGAVAVVGVDGCDSDPGSGSVADSDIVSEVGGWAANWLAGLTGPGSRALDCPGHVVGASVASSGGEARGCVWRDSASRFWLKVQNLSRVPLTVSFRTSWASLEPGATNSYQLDSPRYGQSVTFRPDIVAATSHAVVEYVRSKANPVVAWRQCGTSLTPGCVLQALETLLPENLKIRGVNVPAKRLVGLMNTIWEYAPLVNAYSQRATGTAGGLLTITRG